MPDQKISADTLTPPADTGFFPWVTSGLLNVRATFSQLVAYLKTSFAGYFSGGGPNYISGNWFYPYGQAGVGFGTTATTAGDIAFYPVSIPSPVTVKAVGIRVTTLAAGGNVAIGIYANNPATNKPTGTPLASATGLSTAAATTVSAALGATLTFQPGIYWIAVQVDNTTAILQTPSNTTPLGVAIIGSPSLPGATPTATTTGPQALFQAGTYPTLPDMTAASPATTSGNKGAAVYLQVN